MRIYKHDPKIINKGKDRTREMARLRDKHTCQGCKKIWEIGTRRFDIHHLNGVCGKKSKKYDKVTELDGLITLCHKCHFNRHDWAGRFTEKRSKTIERNNDIREHRKRGLKLHEIGKMYGVSHQRVSQILGVGN